MSRKEYQVTRRENISRELAEDYLEFATVNYDSRIMRTLAESNSVMEYAYRMRKGDWPTENKKGYDVSFDQDGLLTDGVVRLTAVVKAEMNVPVALVVRRDWDNMPMDRSAPPTEKQLARIAELMDHPVMNTAMEEMDEEKWERMISNRGGAGVLINWMKGKIKKAEANA